MGLFRRGKAVKAVAEELATNLVGGRCWDDVALDIGIDAVKDRHLLAGLALLRECRDDHELRSLRVRALARAAIGQSREIREQFSEQLPDADAADVLLWLGFTVIAEAWEIRGIGWSSTVGEERFRLFFATLREARDPLMAAAELVHDDPTPWVGLQEYARGMQLDRDQKDLVWRKVVERAPTHYAAHWGRLQSLAEKWSGSHREMFDFARGAVDSAPDGSAVAAILPLAHAEYLLREGSKLLGNREVFGYAKLHTSYFTDEVVGELVAAEHKWSATSGSQPMSLEAHNLFGWAMLHTERLDRAGWHLRATRHRPSSVPWAYFGDAKVEFAEALVKLNLA